MPDDLLVTVRKALNDGHGWNWSSLVSGEWIWKPSCVRDWLRALVARCEQAEAEVERAFRAGFSAGERYICWIEMAGEPAPETDAAWSRYQQEQGR